MHTGSEDDRRTADGAAPTRETRELDAAVAAMWQEDADLLDAREEERRLPPGTQHSWVDVDRDQVGDHLRRFRGRGYRLQLSWAPVPGWAGAPGDVGGAGDAPTLDPLPRRIRVFRAGTPAFLELHQHPTLGERIDLKGIEVYDTPNDAHEALDGLAVLREYMALRTGRPRDATNYTPEQFRRRHAEERAAWIERTGRPPTIVELTAELGISDDTYRRYVHERRWLEGFAAEP